MDLMRMKNRFSKMGKSLLGAACLLSSCVITYSCSDDYDLPDTKPGFLGESIYDELKKRGNFNTVVRLIDDLAYAEVLSKTGSKTLFVAADTAFESFFKTTRWTDGFGNPVRSYDQLSLGQKKMLLNGTMLNNAYVMEMLPNTAGGGKNLCLRQATAATAADTVPYFKYNELPVITNPADKDYWKEYARPERGGIYLALDRTQPFMTHFLEGHMNNRNITKSDVALVLNQRNASWVDEGENRSYIYNRMVIEQDVTCLNGYFNVLDGVLITPSNMAEEIRTSGMTNHFSRILERFSAPFYSADLTQEYSALHDIQGDSVFQKRYFSERSQGNSKISRDPKGEVLANFPFLSYDPGWNTLAVSNSAAVETDMAAMFVPNDDAMLSFFQTGQGAALVKRYAPEVGDPATVLTHENLGEYIDLIPLNIVRALINNLMKESFSESVPSKFLSIMNDARDPMFADYTEEGYKNLIDKCILANNGVVYIINKVISPADYAAVSAPVLISGEAEILNKAITIDDSYVNGSDYGKAPLQQYFSTYLKSMQSSFSFFVPTDSALANFGYINPATFCSGIPNDGEKMVFTLDTEHQNAVFPIVGKSHHYDEEADQLATKASSTSPYNTNYEDLRKGLGLLKARLLIEMINQHIVVHENEDMVGVRSGLEYYESRGGAPVRIVKTGSGANGEGMQVEGGHQNIRNTDVFADNDQVCTVTLGYNQTRDNGYGNGMTYFLDRPIEPTYRSVYNVMKGDPDYSTFYSLLTDKLQEAELEKMGLRPDYIKSQAQWEAEAKKYQVFVWLSDLPSKVPASGEALVRFFNNYRYTVYVPTNDALQALIDDGTLPTWDDIRDILKEEKNMNPETGQLNDSVKSVAQVMLTQLLNVLRYHFQDKAVYVDNITETDTFQTSSLDEINNVYRTVTVSRTPGTLKVNGVSVTGKRNVLARDINFSTSPGNYDTDNASVVNSSSAVVLHQIDGVLDYGKQGNASLKKRYMDALSSRAKAKAFVEKYKISK